MTVSFGNRTFFRVRGDVAGRWLDKQPSCALKSLRIERQSRAAVPTVPERMHGHDHCCASANGNRVSGFILGPAVSRYEESLNLIAALDHLRDAYDLAKNAGHLEIQGHLMEARRKLVVALHQSVHLHSQLAELQERSVQERRESRISGEDPIALLTPLSDATIRRRTSSAGHHRFFDSM